MRLKSLARSVQCTSGTLVGSCVWFFLYIYILFIYVTPFMQTVQRYLTGLYSWNPTRYCMPGHRGPRLACCSPRDWSNTSGSSPQWYIDFCPYGNRLELRQRWPWRRLLLRWQYIQKVSYTSGRIRNQEHMHLLSGQVGKSGTSQDCKWPAGESRRPQNQKAQRHIGRIYRQFQVVTTLMWLDNRGQDGWRDSGTLKHKGWHFENRQRLKHSRSVKAQNIFRSVWHSRAALVYDLEISNP